LGKNNLVLIKAQDMAEIYYAHVGKGMTKQQKLDALLEKRHIFNVEWQEITPDAKNNWLTEGLQADFETFIPIGSKEEKSSKRAAENVIFKNYGRGVATSRDAWAYNFSREELANNMRTTIEVYNDHVARYSRMKDKPDIDDFVSYDDKKLSWSRDLKS
jgi:predicted helicase